jgi:hypothetical protein
MIGKSLGLEISISKFNRKHYFSVDTLHNRGISSLLFFESLPQDIDQCQLGAVHGLSQIGWCPGSVRDECSQRH